MWPFKKKVPAPPTPESELRISLREASKKLFNKKRDDYVELVLKRCRDASEKGEFSIECPEKESTGEFYDWAKEAFRILKVKGLDVKLNSGYTRATISWN